MIMNRDDEAPTSGAPNEEQQKEASSPAAPPAKPKARRGFAVMDPKLVSQIARKGGKAAHAAGTAHEFTSEEARAAGRKGGLAPHGRRKSSNPPPPTGGETGGSSGGGQSGNT